MISALVAIDPTSEKGTNFERFCSLLRLFQKKGILSQTSIASTIHASLYAVPLQWYREMKDQFEAEALHAITKACEGRFDFDSAKVLFSDSHLNESLVSQLVKYGVRRERDILVVSSNDRAGLPHWILGSFSETAALVAKIPVLVIKPHIKEDSFSKEVRFVLPVDAAVPMSKKSLRWMINFAKAVKAHVDIVYVEARPRPLIDSLQQRQPKNVANKVLKSMSQEFRAAGVSSRIEMLEESKTIAHTIAEYAERQKAWLTVTVSAERSTARKLLLGSTARRVLSITERPFLNLRLE